MLSHKFYRILPPLVCLIACTAVNLLYFPRHPIFPDEQRFLASAAKLAASGKFWVGSDRAWEMPGTALFFAPSVWLFGPINAVIPIRLLQSLLLACQTGLVALIAQRITRNNIAAFFGAAIVALYPFFLFYQGLLLSETLFNTLLLAGLASLYQWRHRGGRIDGVFVLCCACFAAATLTKASLTVLPPLLVALAAWTRDVTWRRAFAVLIAASCLYALFLSPWWIRNELLLARFVPFTTGSAQNLYLGNNPHNPEGGIDWSRDVEPDVASHLLAIPDEVTRQQAFSKAAVNYIEAHPVEVFRVAAKKFVRYWNVIPNAAEFGGWYAFVSAATFGPIIVLAIVGLLRQRREWRTLMPLLTIVAYFTLLHTLTIASLRYRLPIEPILIVLAVEPLAVIAAWLHTRRTPSSG